MITLLFVRMRPSALLFTAFIELLFTVFFYQYLLFKKVKKRWFPESTKSYQIITMTHVVMRKVYFARPQLNCAYLKLKSCN